MDGLAGDGHLPQELFRVGTQSLTGQGEGKFAVFALEEPSTERFLQSTNPALTAGWLMRRASAAR